MPSTSASLTRTIKSPERSSEAAAGPELSSDSTSTARVLRSPSARDRPVDLRLVRALGLRSARAVEVLSLESSGPAAASDLRSGDLIVRVNDADVDGIDSLHRQLARIPPDSTLTLRIVRRTQLRAIELTVREPPA